MNNDVRCFALTLTHLDQVKFNSCSGALDLLILSLFTSCDGSVCIHSNVAIFTYFVSEHFAAFAYERLFPRSGVQSQQK